MEPWRKLGLLCYHGHMYNMPGVTPARTKEEVDNRVELWHDLSDETYEALGRPSLNEYLGWSEQGYWDWFFNNRIPKE